MSENKRKTIRYPLHAKRLIVLVLIQAFLLLDFAWAGGNDLCSQRGTLSPRLVLNTQFLQNTFYAEMPKTEEAVEDLTQQKDQYEKEQKIFWGSLFGAAALLYADQLSKLFARLMAPDFVKTSGWPQEWIINVGAGYHSLGRAESVLIAVAAAGFIAAGIMMYRKMKARNYELKTGALFSAITLFATAALSNVGELLVKGEVVNCLALHWSTNYAHFQMFNLAAIMMQLSGGVILAYMARFLKIYEIEHKNISLKNISLLVGAGLGIACLFIPEQIIFTLTVPFLTAALSYVFLTTNLNHNLQVEETSPGLRFMGKTLRHIVKMIGTNIAWFAGMPLAFISVILYRMRGDLDAKFFMDIIYPLIMIPVSMIAAVVVVIAVQVKVKEEETVAASEIAPEKESEPIQDAAEQHKAVEALRQLIEQAAGTAPAVGIISVSGLTLIRQSI
ncbi:MAG: signal peptidase II [Candidatus Omnitrophota bacterium]